MIFKRGGSVTFGVYTQVEGRWTMISNWQDEGGARKAAESQLVRDTVEGVRVTRIRMGITGEETEKTIAEKIKPKRESATFVPNRIDSAPVCRTVADCYGIRARIALGRALGKYIDKQGVTVTELMHSVRELKRVQDAGMLVPGVISNIANLQAAATGEKAAVRVKALQDLFAQVYVRARTAESLKLPGFGEGGLQELLDLLRPSVDDPDERAFRFRMAVSRELLSTRSLPGKMERLLLTSQTDMDEEAIEVLDTFVADCLSASDVIKEILGPQRNLAAAMMALLALAHGRMETRETADPNSALGRLNRLLGTGVLPECQAMLLDRVRRELAGSQPLSRDDPSRETDAFALLVNALSSPDGLIGGAGMAAALVERCATIQDKGGKSGVQAGIQGVGLYYTSLWGELAFLLSLMESHLAREHADTILPPLEDAFSGVRNIDHLLSFLPTPRARMKQIKLLRRRVEGLSTLDGARKSLMLTQLDKAADAYRTENGL